MSTIPATRSMVRDWRALAASLAICFAVAGLLDFRGVSRRTAGLLAPYLASVTFAAALNFAIRRLNP